MNDSNAWAQRLLELSRGADEPSRADRARVRTLLVARCLLEPSLTAAAHAGASSVVGSSKSVLGSKALLSKALVAFGIGGAAGAVTSAAVVGLAPERSPRVAPVVASSAPRTPPAVPRPSLAPAAPVVSAPAFQPAPEVATAAVSPAARNGSPETPLAHGPSATPEPMPAPSTLSVELDALRRAQQLLHRGEAVAALGVLRELDGLVPAGALGEERAATRALATCAANGRDHARVAEFLRRHPRSVHLARVKAACEPATAVTEIPDTDPPGSSH
jgi:hypothetical protein